MQIDEKHRDSARDDSDDDEWKLEKQDAASIIQLDRNLTINQRTDSAWIVSTMSRIVQGTFDRQRDFSIVIGSDHLSDRIDKQGNRQCEHRS